MKATFQYGLAAYTGKADGVVYCYHRYQNKVYVRRNTYPRLTDENERIAGISSVLFGIQPAEGYKEDMRLYLYKYRLLRYGNSPNILCWSSLYIKLMYNMAKADPSIDLRTITREYIYDNDLPCISVKKAVEAGLLPEVYGWEAYIQEM